MTAFIGVMSGTSLDGIDVVVVEFDSEDKFKLEAAQTYPYDAELRASLLRLIEHQQCSLTELGQLDMALGQASADAILKLLRQHNMIPEHINAIGSHGQTICHAPDVRLPFSMQIGNPSLIAEKTGITTVSDFRARDMVVGGQGAPLVPAFHQALFNSDSENRVILNIGGISNITVLSKEKNSQAVAFDTGPGNVLMDAWIQRSTGADYDDSGNWAAQGHANEQLLAWFMEDSYFSRPAPKSTGRERFNSRWLNTKLDKYQSVRTLSAVDTQTTLARLTAVSIVNDIKKYAPETDAVYVCGGGAHNHNLLNLLKELLGANIKLASTEVLGLSPDWVEACAFAWLARQTMLQRPGNLPSATGALKTCILGGIYLSSQAS